MLAQPAYSGLKVYSLHLLSDYYFAGGFRATAGLVRGYSYMPWWPADQQGATGLHLSMQRLDMLHTPGQDRAQGEGPRKVHHERGPGEAARRHVDDLGHAVAGGGAERPAQGDGAQHGGAVVVVHGDIVAAPRPIVRPEGAP